MVEEEFGSMVGWWDVGIGGSASHGPRVPPFPIASPCTLRPPLDLPRRAFGSPQASGVDVLQECHLDRSLKSAEAAPFQIHQRIGEQNCLAMSWGVKDRAGDPACRFEHSESSTTTNAHEHGNGTKPQTGRQCSPSETASPAEFKAGVAKCVVKPPGLKRDLQALLSTPSRRGLPTRTGMTTGPNRRQTNRSRRSVLSNRLGLSGTFKRCDF
ncbi:hypothetical protein C8R44DRAFT_739320 [Mycena epipterygia]|nr:hypothetical protein C8R44DRAFT_739320 [Mycena epipterygia]